MMEGSGSEGPKTYGSGSGKLVTVVPNITGDKLPSWVAKKCQTFLWYKFNIEFIKIFHQPNTTKQFGAGSM